MKVDNNGLRLSVLLVLFQKIDSNDIYFKFNFTSWIWS